MILSNAVKYSNGKGIQLKVTVDEIDNRLVRFKIIDSGSGIPSFVIKSLL